MYYDIIIFNYINSFAGRFKVLDILGIFLANYVPYLLVLLLCLFLWWPKGDIVKNRIMVFVALISASGARFVAKNIILFFYDRPRPYLILPSSHKLISVSVVENMQSFPSGHAIFFFALSTVIYFYNKRLGVIFFVCSTIMGLARIFVGVHWPSDILGGLILGVITAYIVRGLYLKYVHGASKQ